MRIILFVLLVFLGGQIRAQAQEPVSIDLAKDTIEVSAGFVGDFLTVYGHKEGDGQVVLTITGPKRTILVRQKKQFLGAWFYQGGEVFKDIPGFYHYALDKDGASFSRYMFEVNEKADPVFWEALIRNKKKEGLYPTHPASIKFISNQFFKAQFYIPANVPLGEYQVEAKYIDENSIVSVAKKSFEVGHIGFLASIYYFSLHYEWVYGFLCIMIAVVAGWISNRLRGHI